MPGTNSLFREACTLIGECYLMLSKDDAVSRSRIALWLERTQEEVVESNGSQDDALRLAIEHLRVY